MAPSKISIFSPKKSGPGHARIPSDPDRRRSRSTEQWREEMAKEAYKEDDLQSQRPTQELFGKIAGIEPGAAWNNREECSKAGVHRPPRDGISGNARDGAASIVLSGGYETDVDEGDKIKYTGTGGLDPNTKQIIADQDPEQEQNKAMERSLENKSPVRVIRGSNGNRKWSPKEG